MTTQVPWGQLDGDTTEKIVATLLCLEHPNANRIRPTQGDGGVDILVPTADGAVDVYQVKAYASGIKGSRGSKIKKSLATVAANDMVKVQTWYLTIPLDPTLEGRQDWLAELRGTVAFDCQWFGLTNLDGLAAKHPEVIEYYLGDGRARVEATIQSLLQLSNMTCEDERGQGKLLSPRAVRSASFGCATLARFRIGSNASRMLALALSTDLDVLGSRTEVGQLRVAGLQLPQQRHHRVAVTVANLRLVTRCDQVPVQHSVDPVDRTCWTGCRDQVLGVLKRSGHRRTRDARRVTLDEGPDSSRLIRA